MEPLKSTKSKGDTGVSSPDESRKILPAWIEGTWKGLRLGKGRNSASGDVYFSPLDTDAAFGDQFEGIG